MTHQLSIRLDSNTDMALPLSYSSGTLLRGEVTFVPETDIYLNSITVMLVYSITPLGISMAAGDEDELYLVARGLFGFGDEFAKPNKKDLRDLQFEAGEKTIVDQRKISKETMQGFANALTAENNYSWRFTFPLPNEPWSYKGKLFQIHWRVEGKADIGRGPVRLINPFRHVPETLTEFTLASG